MRPVLALAMLAWLVPAPLRAADRKEKEPVPGPLFIEWSVPVPMRDGVKLNARVYHPPGATAPSPALVALGPYTVDRLHPWATYFGRHGYVVALVDTRGRGDSEGRFEPNAADGKDGFDLVEWIARQPWCDGKVGMFGGSYLGFAQWATAGEVPPHLASIAPTAAVLPGFDFPMLRGIASPYAVQWIATVSGRALNWRSGLEDATGWVELFKAFWAEKRPFRDLDRFAGLPDAWFQAALEHPQYDAWWRRFAPTDEAYGRIRIPVLSITGHYDDDQPGALEHYSRHIRNAPADAAARHFLVIGPWDHFGTRAPAADLGGLKVASAGVLDVKDLHRRWFDWTLRGGARPELLGGRVAYYVMAAEEWRHAARFEDAGGKPRTFYLRAGEGGARDAFHSGELAAAPGASPPATWSHDPLGATALEREAGPAESSPGWIRIANEGNWLIDQREALQTRGTAAVYHSEPLAADAVLAGRPSLHAYVELDVADEDLFADLCELKADGASVLLSRALLRARHRRGIDRDEPAVPGRVEPYEFTFDWIARRLSKGSRVRLLVGSLDSIWFERNFHAVRPVAEQTASDTRVAHVKLFGDAKRPSTLTLPLE